MNKGELIRKVAYLETVNDQVVAELHYVDTLLREIGFPDGLKTVKNAAKELLDKEKEEEEGEVDSFDSEGKFE